MTYLGTIKSILPSKNIHGDSLGNSLPPIKNVLLENAS